MKLSTGKPTRTGVRRLAYLAASAAIAVATMIGISSPAMADTHIAFDNQIWYCGDSVSSSTVELVFQCDGNLVLYQLSNHKALWATGTNGWGVSQVQFVDSNGEDNIYLDDSYGVGLCFIPGFQATLPSGSYASVQNDGNFVLYTSSGHAVWASDTNGFAQGSTNLCYGFDYDLR